jgi:hypothetical protein
MKTHILKGSKQEIADRIVKVNGEVREAIVFEEESAPPQSDSMPDDSEDIFAEMASLMVDTPKIDDSREAIYTHMEGE